MKKISKLLIGTNNKGKYKEIKDLLPKYIKTYSTSEFKLKSPKEDGLTFTENSILKSKYFSKKTRLICLADDSGLEIDLLNKSFDPNFHQAMMEIEDDQKEPGTIVQEVQKGFIIKDRLLRPSLVGVSKKTEHKDDKSEENKENLDK